MFAVGVYGESILSPPVCCVYHPANVYPSLVGSGNSSILLSVYVAVNVPLSAPNMYFVH